MSREFTDEQLRELAAQFRCPHGKQGLKTGENMFKTNKHITEISIDLLSSQSGEVIMEIGCGVARQAKILFEKTPKAKFWGVEISPEMLSVAQNVNQEHIQKGEALFFLSDGNTLPLPDGACDKIFTVNTLYFWKDPQKYLMEIHRVLKPKGRLCVTFAIDEFMGKLPFSKYGFTLYNQNEAENLFQKLPFRKISVHTETEPHVSHVSDFADRKVVFILVEKE